MTKKTIESLNKNHALPRLEGRMILSRVTGYSHAELIIHQEIVLSESQIEAFEAMVTLRKQGQPMAYILGEKEFYGRNFKVTQDVLIPRPDSETLIEWAKAQQWTHHPKVLDLGTGSGILAITLQLELKAEVVGVDISQEALFVAAQNAEYLNAKVKWLHSSWFKSVPEQEFDLIVSNPPYIRKEDVHLGQGDLRFEPQQALTDYADGLSCFREIIDQSGQYLRFGAWIALEHGFDQGYDCRQLLKKAGFENIETKQDLSGNDRISVAKRGL